MSGKEILLKAVRNELTERPAWVPFVGVHGGKLTGKPATEYLQSADLMIQGLSRAVELYRPDGLPVAFDLQLEAEVLGCELAWADENPPSVCTHPLESGAGLADLPVFDAGKGRFPVIIETLRKAKELHGDTVAFYGLLCGPFTLALHLMGTGIFLKMFDHPDYVKAVVGFCAAVGKKAAQIYLENGADVIAVVDPMTSQISPGHFGDFVAPQVNDIFDHIRNLGGLSSLFVCGDASRNMEAMSGTRCDNLSIDENVPLDFVRDVTRGTGRSFGGNMKLTSVLLFGDEDDCRLEAIRCIDIGGECGFILAPGCDLPYGVPEKNLQAVAEMVHDGYSREIAKRTIVAKSAAGEAVELPDYDSEPNLIIDVITLDSSSCAPCKYMMDAVHAAAKALSEPVIVKEHRISTRKGLGVMVKLDVKNIPTICIGGEAVFSSIIPDRKTLEAAIRERVRARGGG